MHARSRMRLWERDPFWPLVIVAGFVVVANAVYLLGISDPNPMATYAGLTSFLEPGRFPGIDYVDPNVGFTAQAFGHLAASDWLHGRVPWWNPYEGIGSPLAGEMQAAAFFPPVLFDILPWGQELFRLCLELVAGFSAYFLLHRLVPSRAVATGGAVVFALNGTFAWMFHAPANPAAFAPLVLLGVEQARSGERRLAGVATIAVALALSLYAGFPETAFIDGLLAVLWFVVRATEVRGRELLAFAGRAAAGAAGGLLLAAPLLVAFLTYLPHADVAGHTRGFAASHLDRSVALPDLVLPYVFGPILGWAPYDHSGTLGRFWSSVGGYLGVSVLLLAAVGLVGRPHRRLRIALALWVVFTAGRSAGIPVLTKVVNSVPGVSTTAFYRYYVPSAALAAVALAALGAADLVVARRPRRSLIAGGVGVIAVLWAGGRAWQVLRRVRGAPHNHVWAAGSILFALGLVAVVVAAAVLLRRPRWRAAAFAAVLAGEALAMFVVPQLSAPRRAVIDTGPVRYLQAHLGTARFYTLGPISPDYGSYWRLGSLAINDVPVPKAYAAFITSRLDSNVNPVLFTGTTAGSSAQPGPAAQFVAHLAAYEDAGVAYLVTPAAAVLPALPAGVALPVVYADGRVVIRRLPAPAGLLEGTGGCRVLTAALSQAAVDCRGRGGVVYRELTMPGWAATVDGRGTPVHPFETVFQQVALGPGTHRVAFSYAPPYTGAAQIALGLGLALVVACGALGWRERRAGAPPGPPGPPGAPGRDGADRREAPVGAVVGAPEAAAEGDADQES